MAEQDPGSTEMPGFTLGNAMSIGLHDPESHGIEAFLDTPCCCGQAHLKIVDLNGIDAPPLAQAKKMASTCATFQWHTT
jgi:hypothetical protein